jgi:hypothetical protein
LLIIAGAKSEEHAKNAARTYAKIISKLDNGKYAQKIKLKEFKVQSIITFYFSFLFLRNFIIL